MLENNIPIDTRYYLDNQLKNPLLRIFEPILKDAESQLLGEFLGEKGGVVMLGSWRSYSYCVGRGPIAWWVDEVRCSQDDVPWL